MSLRTPRAISAYFSILPITHLIADNPNGDLDKSLRTGKNRPICSKREGRTMEFPQVNSIGLTEIPPGFQARRRRYSFAARVVATVVLAVFTLVVMVTTVVSLGAYCLTVDASNTSGLPQSYLRP